MANTRKLKALGYKVFEYETVDKIKVTLIVKGKDARVVIESDEETKEFRWRPTIEVIYEVEFIYAFRDVDNGYLIKLCRENGLVKKEIKYHPNAGVLDITGALKHLGEMLIYYPDTTEDVWAHDFIKDITYGIKKEEIKRCGYDSYNFNARLRDGQVEIGDTEPFWHRVKTYEIGPLLKDAIIKKET